MPIDLRRLDPSALAPARPRRDPADRHFVEFYDDLSGLVDTVETFIAAGLRRHDGAIVISDSVTSEAIESNLMASGFVIPSLRENGRYLSLDAETTLARFMVGGTPDPHMFFGSIGTLIEKVSPDGRTRIYGDMVAKLWARGNVAAAVQLEELWNELADRYPFDLFCAYPSDVFDEVHLEQLGGICRAHSHVIPPGR